MSYWLSPLTWNSYAVMAKVTGAGTSSIVMYSVGQQAVTVLGPNSGVAKTGAFFTTLSLTTGGAGCVCEWSLQ